MNVIDKALANDINAAYAPISHLEELECIRLAKTGDNVSQNKLINSQLKLIVSIARGYSSDINNIRDLISEGTIGLVDAINHYDFDRADGKFASFAQWWIRNQITSMVYDNQTIRLPRNQSKCKKAVRDENGKIIKEKQEGARINTTSINAPVSDDANASTFESILADTNSLSADTSSEYSIMMAKLTNRLNARELEMFEARVFDDLTYEEIGARFGINTREGVRQHLNKIIEKAQRICTKK